MGGTSAGRITVASGNWNGTVVGASGGTQVLVDGVAVLG
jgi:hypothetical protein